MLRDDYIYSKEVKLATTKVLVFDGQIDPDWIEFINVIEDNLKIFYLDNNNSVSLEGFKIIFETTELKQITPSFLARVNIVYFEQSTYNWEMILFNWINTHPMIIEHPELKNFIKGLFENYFPKFYDYIQSNKTKLFKFEENFVMKNLITLFDAILPKFDFEEKKIGKRDTNYIPRIEVIKTSILSSFIFTSAWIVNFFTNFLIRMKVEKLISDSFKADDLKGPIFDYFIDPLTYEFKSWEQNYEALYPEFVNPTRINALSQNKVFVLNQDNIPYLWIMEKYLRKYNQIFFFGQPNSGKTFIINSVLNHLDSTKTEFYMNRYLINFNSTTKNLHKYLVSHTDYINREEVGDSYERNMVFFIDDVNLQKTDSTGVKPCLEYLRQIASTKSFYDFKQNITKRFVKFSLINSDNLTAHKANSNLDRYIHSFCIISKDNFTDEATAGIFKPRLEAVFKKYIPSNASITANQYIHTTVNVFDFVNQNFKRTRDTLHYLFNFRTLNRIFESIEKHKYEFRNEDYPTHLLEIWFHEIFKSFTDRLLTNEEKDLLLDGIYKKYVSTFKSKSINSLKESKLQNLIFAPELVYEELHSGKDSHDKHHQDHVHTTEAATEGNDNLIRTNSEFHKSQSLSSSHIKENYLFYPDELALEEKISKIYTDHFEKQTNFRYKIFFTKETFYILLKILRAINFDKGHSILIGTSLSGRQTLSKFAAFLQNFEFEEFNTSHINKKKNEIIIHTNELIAESIYTNKPLMIFYPEGILENENVLEQINNLYNIYDILNMNKLKKDKNEKNDINITDFLKKFSGEDKYSVSDNEIIGLLKKNLKIMLKINYKSPTYFKIFEHYHFITKNSFFLFCHSWDDAGLLGFARKFITPNEKENSLTESISLLLVEAHNCCLTLRDEYSHKLDLIINSSHLVKLVNFYNAKYNVYNSYLKNQLTIYQFALEALEKNHDVITKTEDEVQKLEPKKDEIDKIIDEKTSELSKKSSIRNTIQSSITELEKLMMIENNKKDYNIKRIQEALQATDEVVVKCNIQCGRLDKAEFIDFRNSFENHILSKFILSQMLALAEDPSEIETYFKKNNGDPKFIKYVTTIDYKNPTQDFIRIVKEAVVSPDFQPETLSGIKIYNTCRLMCEWFKAMNAYIIEWEGQSELFKENEQCDSKIDELNVVLSGKKSEMDKINEECGAIERIIKTQDNNKRRMLQVINKKTELIDINKGFLDLCKLKLELWEQKSQEINMLLTNYEFYLAYLSVYFIYGSLFQHSQRKKITQFFTAKAERMNLVNITNLDFNTLLQDFTNDLKEKDLLRVYNMFDDYTRENLTMINLCQKTPLIIDTTRMAKLILSEYLEKIEPSHRLTVANPLDKEFNTIVEKAMKEGHFLIIDKADEKVYYYLKNVINANYTIERGKKYVKLETEDLKEVGEKFKLFLIKDLHEADNFAIENVFFMETDIVNCILNISQSKAILWKSLICYREKQLWDNQQSSKNDFFMLKIKGLDIEEKLLTTIQAFDYTGNVERNQFNGGHLDRFRLDAEYYNTNINNIKQIEEKRLDIKIDISIYEKLCEDAAKIYKRLLKFTNMNKIYNIHLLCYSKIINRFYDEK